MCPLVPHHDLRGASDTVATKPTSGGQRNLFLTLDALLPQKVLTHMSTHAHAWHCCKSLLSGAPLARLAAPLEEWMDRTQCSMWVAASRARGPLSAG